MHLHLAPGKLLCCVRPAMSGHLPPRGCWLPPAGAAGPLTPVARLSWWSGLREACVSSWCCQCQLWAVKRGVRLAETPLIVRQDKKDADFAQQGLEGSEERPPARQWA